jgi:anti-sigma-K factor RskA
MIDEPPVAMNADEALAADFALGALGLTQMRAAELRMLRDPAFRAAVEAWQADLNPLAQQLVETAPSPEVWERIAAEIDPIVRAKAAPRGLWASLNFWRAFSVASTSAAAVAVALLLAPVTPVSTSEPLLAATLKSTDGAVLISAAYDPYRHSVILSPSGNGPDAQHSPELWLIDGSAAPRSLGLIDMNRPQQRSIAVGQLHPGVVLAVSIEARGGSTTGLPQGPVVATGKLSIV